MVTGSVDYVTDGTSGVLVCHNVPELQAITAVRSKPNLTTRCESPGKYSHCGLALCLQTGCSLSSLIGAFIAVDDNHCRAAAHACAYFSLAAERAANNLRQSGAHVGPGSMRVATLDWLAGLDPDVMKALARIEPLQ